ncbi:hypothetical protein ACOMHN_011008 [Nucella lapillus]
MRRQAWTQTFTVLPRFLYFSYVKMKSRGRLVRAAISKLLYCECLHYFVVLLQCTWPQLHTLSPTDRGSDLVDTKVMLLADTHLLGIREGHWFDKLRREWQMKRAFQTSMLLHRPHVVFVLDFQNFPRRYHSVRNIPYMFNHTYQSVGLLRIEGIVFVLFNSMAMEKDGYGLCRKTQKELAEVSLQLQCAKQRQEGISEGKDCRKYESFQYSKPILLQHFPLFRPSDVNCSTEDAAPPSEKIVPFEPKYDALSKEATAQLFRLLEPRLVFGAHGHHGCYHLHDNGVPEWTVASFNWRNKQNPSFLMACISASDHKVRLCQMPDERTVIVIYIAGVVVILLSLCLPLRKGHKTS